MIERTEELWSPTHVVKEVTDLFGEFDESRWDLGAGTDESFEAVLAGELSLDEFYREEIGFVYQAAWNQSTNDERTKYLSVLECAKEYGVKSVMDYGCGIGSGCVILADAGIERVIAAEVNRPSLDLIEKRKARFGLENLQVYDLGEKTPRVKVDMIVCTEVFEHVDDPMELAEYLDKRLRPGGVLWLSWSFVKMPTHLEKHFHLQAPHPDQLLTHGFGKFLVEELGWQYVRHGWFTNMIWVKPEDA